MPESYPEEILPKSNYILEMDISKLIKVYPSLYVARRIDGDKHQLVLKVDGDDVLSDAALKTTNVANFSVNLIGGLFDANNHIQFRPLQDDITKQWRGEAISPNDMDRKYEIKEPCFAVYYKITDFIKFPLIQEMSFQSENDLLGFKAIAGANRRDETYLKAFSKGKIVELPVKKKVNHATIGIWFLTHILMRIPKFQLTLQILKGHIKEFFGIYVVIFSQNGENLK